MKPIPVDFHIGPLRSTPTASGSRSPSGSGSSTSSGACARTATRPTGSRPSSSGSSSPPSSAPAPCTCCRTSATTPGTPATSSPSGMAGSPRSVACSAVPVGIILTRRRCPELPIATALDLAVPVLLACWAMGRLLGPQLMVAGGGHPTHQWFGMYYAGQRGPRLPVPVFQALEDFTVYLVLIAIERRLDRWPDGARRRAIPRGSCSAPPWCCGASSAPSTNTCGWARTANSVRISYSWPA